MKLSISFFFCFFFSTCVFSLDVLTYRYVPNLQLEEDSNKISLKSSSLQQNSLLLPLPLHLWLPFEHFQMVYLYDHVDDGSEASNYRFDFVMQTLFAKYLDPQHSFGYFFLAQKVTNEQAFSDSDFKSVIYGINASALASSLGFKALDLVIRHEWLYGKRKNSMYLKIRKELTDSFSIDLMAISHLIASLYFPKTRTTISAGIKGADVFLPQGFELDILKNFGRGSETKVFVKTTQKLKQYFSLGLELGATKFDFDFIDQNSETLARMESEFSSYLALSLQLDL